MASKPQDSSGPDGAGTPGEPVLWNRVREHGEPGRQRRHDRPRRGLDGSSTTSGRPYLDAIASLWYCNVGHGRAELADAAAAQMRQLAGYQTFETSPTRPPRRSPAGSRAWPRCQAPRCSSPRAAGPTRWTPRPSWPAATGAPLGQEYKQVTIGRSHAYHGMNAYGTSLGGIPANTAPFVPLVSLVEHVAWDDAAALEKAIENLGARAGGRVLLRAGHRGRRRVPAAGGLPGQRPGDLPQA